MSKRPLLLTALALLTVSIPAVAFAAPASAAESTVTTIATAEPVEAGFGSNWVVEVVVTADESPVDSGAGTIDAYLTGIAGAFASDVPIQAGGRAFISQPDSGALLPAGSYALSAVFTPAAGSGLDTSQSASTLSVTITAIDLAPSFSLGGGATEDDPPVVRLTRGADPAIPGGAPAGDWQVTVTEQGARSTPVYAEKVHQGAEASDSLQIAIRGPLEPGKDYTVTAQFVPDGRSAGGVTVAPMGDQELHIPALTFAERITEPVALPLAAVIAGGVLTLLLVLVAIILPFVLLRRARPASTPTSTPEAPLEA